MIGQSVSHYQILDKLGEGGMGVVYKAEDTKLKRAVALKFLPEELSRDKHALERFQREAQAASALNHPNICTIYDIDEHEGRHFIAMECLEGNTLKHRIHGKSLGMDEILELAIQIADGLDAAHSKGIIHRDIKPANLFITKSGHAKILDFGLAKLAPERLQGAEAATATAKTETAEAMLTSPGTAVGTVAYMSPEQALGKDLDARTDLFSFGAVLYEMATGLLPFRGTTSAATFNAILNFAPTPPVRINPDLPAELERVINKALEKDREVRYQHASDLRADLKRLKRDTESGRAATAAAVAETSGKSAKTEQTTRKWKWALAGVVLMVMIGIGVTWFAGRRVQPQPPPELKETRLTNNPSEQGVAFGCISPEGKYLAYSDRRGMYLKLIETGEERPIPQPEGSAAENTEWYAQYWFPDGTRFLAIRVGANGKCSAWVVSVLGGPPRLLRDNAQGGPPSPDGSQIVFLANVRVDFTSYELWLMGAQGENPRKFLSVTEGEALDYPVWSPDGQRVAYKRYHAGGVSLESRDLKGEQLTTIFFDPKLEVIAGSWWFPNGRMVFTVRAMEPEPNQNDCSLWEIQVDPKTGRPLGQPRRITKWAGFDVAVLNGTTDGRRLAVLKMSGQTDVFVGEWEAKGLRLKNQRRLTLDESYDVPSAWTRDGKAVLFHSNRNGQFDIFKQALGQETAEPVVTGPGNKHDAVFTPDGNLILYLQDTDEGKTRIMRVPSSGGAPEMVFEGKGINGLRCSWSPATLCVLGEESPDRKQYIFAAFDPMKGIGRELTRVSLKQPVERYFWDLSWDGSRLAFAQDLRGTERRIQILPLSRGEVREVVIQREIQMSSLRWAIDGKGFLVGTTTPGGMLLFVDLDGHTEVLWKTGTLWGLTGPRGLPSPDGRHLAMLGCNTDFNVWMLENF